MHHLSFGNICVVEAGYCFCEPVEDWRKRTAEFVLVRGRRPPKLALHITCSSALQTLPFPLCHVAHSEAISFLCRLEIAKAETAVLSQPAGHAFSQVRDLGDSAISVIKML